MASDKRLIAVIWDYDGTLVDTRHKNLNVTRKIIERITKRSADEFPMLENIEEYHRATMETSNWRKFYREEFEIGEEQVNEAGSLWTEYQLNDDTPVKVFEGIRKGMLSIGTVPQGIVSQNSKSSVKRQLESDGLIKYFSHIIGYEEVAMDKQKPEPDGLINCIKELAESDDGTIFYIGDHETDIQCATRANQVLTETGLNVLSIGILYGSELNSSKWKTQPDYEAKSVQELFDIIAKHKA
ncbi:MAG: HAD family hydrolase [Candidatus Marinimicrobia bacterium]|nr:HAD family hydrolase [Candidatus Neomarinimicrobiota bacterium]